VAVGQVVTRVSVDSSGVQANNESYAPAISADGRFVAFVSNATNLAFGTVGGISQVFVHDRATGATGGPTVSSSGSVAGGDGWCGGISADGRFVTFTSNSTSLVAGVETAFYEVYLRDRVAGTTEWVSIPSSGLPGDDSSFAGGISADGRFVVFMSYASNLV